MQSLISFTDREIDVLMLLAQGKNNQQIARELTISVRTVKYHTGNIYSKIGCSSRCEAIAWVWAGGREIRKRNEE